MKKLLGYYGALIAVLVLVIGVSNVGSNDQEEIALDEFTGSGHLFVTMQMK